MKIKYNNKKFTKFLEQSSVIKIEKNQLGYIEQKLKNHRSARLCLHRNIKDKHQEMIIAQKKFNFFPPKKNTESDQTFLILKGVLLIIIFDYKGNIKKKIKLSNKHNLLARVKKNTFHCDIPISKFSIHLETKNTIFNSKVNKLANFPFQFNKKIIKN
tara:strand:+ start:313 stop:786 length:474 start_codon:yes stop_codon:yes gene_type:complete